jgi:hypothetical protein
MKEITMGELSEMVSSMTLMGLPQYSEETEENMMPYETGSGAGRTSSTLAGWATRTLPSLPTVLEKSDEEAATREAKVVLIKVKADIVIKERLGEGGKERARVRWCVAGSCTARSTLRGSINSLCNSLLAIASTIEETRGMARKAPRVAETRPWVC